jgi:FMN phosphatase YigB (HAD superfamily)
MNNEKIVICDIDGTLADIEHRRGYVRIQPSNWSAFNESMHLDTVNQPVKDVYNALRSQGHYMVIFTGRGNDYRNVTEKWLHDNEIFYDELYMRHVKKAGVEPFEDGVSDVIVKQRMLDGLKNLHKDKSILAAIDDRPSVCRDVWVKNDIFLFSVGQMCEDF